MKSGGGRPVGYFNKAEEKVPGTTTITGRGKESGGLLYVAKQKWHEAGRKGLPFERDAYWSDNDALQIGTVVHQWIEENILLRDSTSYPDMPEAFLNDAMSAYDAYVKWRNQTNLKIIITELPLVSDKYGYGGTLDAVAEMDGELVLLDWKTSNATYQDYIAQLAAYRQLWNENEAQEHGGIDDAYLLRVGKEYGDFHVHYWPEKVLDKGWRWFLAAKELYELDKELKKVAS